MKNEPSVGIILVNYNGAADTIDCINSLRNIKYKNIEIIVVDNSSTDDSVELLNEYLNKANEKLIISKQNKGFSAGNNIGIQYAQLEKMDYVLLLNNDTVVEPDFLSEMINSRQSDSDVMTGTICYYTDPQKIWFAGGSVNPLTGRTTHWSKDKEITNLSHEIKEISFVTGCEMLIPIHVITKVGLLDEDYFLYGEDTDYSLRLSKNGIKMLFCPTSIIFHKVSSSTKKLSQTIQYYSVRNRRILIKKNCSWYQKIPALLFANAQTIHRLIHKRQHLYCVLMGIIDFYAKNYGKTERIFKTAKDERNNGIT